MAETAYYGIKYPEPGEPAYLTRGYLQDNAETIEAAMLAGPTPGPPGPTGPAGPPNVLAIGTVTTGAAGTAADATITGTAPAQTLNLTIPRGTDGASGAATNGMPTGGTAGQVLTKTASTDFAAAWAAPSAGAQVFRMMSGALYAPAHTSISTGAPTSGRLWVAPFPVDVPPPSGVNALGVRITVAAAGSTVRLGIYADTGYGYPGTRVLDAGTVSGGSTGDQYATATWTPTAGLYWLAAVATGGNPTLTTINATGMFGPLCLGPSTAALNVSPGSQLYVDSQTGLPTTFPTAGTSSFGGPRVVVRTA